MTPVSLIAALFSVLIPSKMWYAPHQPITIQVQGAEVTLILTDFAGKPFEAKGANAVADGGAVDLRAVYHQMNTPGTYLLFALQKGQEWPNFIGTPLVITVRVDQRRDAPPDPMVTRIVPLQYARVTTELGEMNMIFWYDVAPITIENFTRLSMQGFYDGLRFNRVVPDFLIQAGDPKGDGTGGPGYTINPEFNSRPLTEGVVAMARSNDPLEEQGAMPRYEAANSAGSQFFISLNYTNTRRFDGRYTAFGMVIGSGMETVKKIATSPLAKPETPEKPVIIQKIEVLPVTKDANPYVEQFGMRAR